VGSDAEASDAKDHLDAKRRSVVLEAAARCVRRLGVRKVSIEDIAEEASISRRTLYRLYPNRRAVMRSLIFHRLEKIALAIQDMMRKCPTFEDCVVTGSIQTIKIANKDAVYLAIFEDDRTLILDDPYHPMDKEIEPLFLSTWAPIFERGRKEGKISKHLSDHQLADWLMNVHQMLEWRQDMSDEEQSDLLRTFVLPSLKFAENLGSNSRGAGGRRSARQNSV
jgi:AcrR family transcriptional regulator